MSSILFPSSNITLLTQLSHPIVNPGQSHSKRLYTFINYEHSAHPRRFIILFFTIIFISLSFAWLLAGLVRLRQTASYLESCANGKVQCASGSNLICSLASSICLCPEQTYWNNINRKCSTVKTMNEICSTNQQCDATKGLICYSDGTCQCPLNTYYTINGCTTYASFGESCLVSGASLCNTQLALICDTITQTCLCPSLTYWSNARCESASLYYDYCDQNTSCNTQSGLFCRLPGSYPSCDCPRPSKFYTCDCNQGQTWVTTTGINATSACVNQGTYAGNCSSNSQCPQALNLACVDGTCGCSVPLWFWSWTSNKCLPCESQGYKLIHYTSQWVCTQLISSSLITYAASQSACLALGWSLISPIFANDIPVIAQVYPTYRLWVNIQTSIGNTSYVNNIFPNNQSSWNSYVLNSLTASYSTYIYALQIVPSYNRTMLFEGNTNLDMGHALCALY